MDTPASCYVWAIQPKSILVNRVFKLELSSLSMGNAEKIQQHNNGDHNKKNTSCNMQFVYADLNMIIASVSYPIEWQEKKHLILWARWIEEKQFSKRATQWKCEKCLQFNWDWKGSLGNELNSNSISHKTKLIQLVDVSWLWWQRRQHIRCWWKSTTTPTTSTPCHKKTNGKMNDNNNNIKWKRSAK